MFIEQKLIQSSRTLTKAKIICNRKTTFLTTVVKLGFLQAFLDFPMAMKNLTIIHGLHEPETAVILDFKCTFRQDGGQESHSGVLMKSNL